MAPRPSRGDVWLADLNPVRGHEQAGIRPVVIISTNRFNHGFAGRVVAVPMTTGPHRATWHVAVMPPDGGVRRPSFVKCEDVRSIFVERLLSYWGKLSGARLGEIGDRLRALLEL
jgi:mRNA interferase MazF